MHRSAPAISARPSLRTAAAVAAATLAATALVAVPGAAVAAVSADADLVVSEVYGGGGNSGAPLNRDFVEIANVGDTDLDLTGYSVQYASASGGSW